MAGADVSLTFDDCSDDLTDEGFYQALWDCSPSTSDALPSLQRIRKYAQSGDVFDKPMVAQMVQDLFRTAPAAILTKELPDIMKVLTEEDGCLLEVLRHIPDIAARAVESSRRVPVLKDVIDYLIPILLRHLGSTDAAIDKSAQASLIQLIENGLLSQTQAEIKICPTVLALTKVDTVGVPSSSVILMSKLAPVLGKDITERIFLPRYSELCSTHVGYVKKLAASLIGYYCVTVGPKAYENKLLPCYLSLCEDESWGVRKCCAEVMMFVSCVCPSDLRKTLLAPAFAKLLKDDCRFVRNSANQTLGVFISTFAEPPLTSMRFDSSRELVLVDRDDSEFNPAGIGFTVNSPIDTQECFLLSHEENYLYDKGDTFNNTEVTTDLDSEKKDSVEMQGLNEGNQNPLGLSTNVKTDIESTSTNYLNLKQENLSAEINVDKSKIGSIGKEKHEDDLLYYNEYNYWYISPPEIDVKGLPDMATSLQGDDNERPMLLNLTTSHLEDLYATISLNDTIDESVCQSIESTSDNQGDTLVNSGCDVKSVCTATEIKEFSQDIVPQELIDIFISSGHSDYIAHSFPAVTITLGKENWHLIKDTASFLAGHMSYRVRRTIASSLHELAAILGPEMASEYLTPLFDGFLKDLDEVRIGILRNLAYFLDLIGPEKRVTYLPKLEEFLKLDNVCNWRFLETFAHQLTESVKLFEPADIARRIGNFAPPLLFSNVAAVRHAAIILVTEIVKHIKHDHRLANFLLVISQRLGHNKKWKPRQTFALMCSELLNQKALDPDVFASLILPHLLDLSWDAVPNVRLLVAKCIVQHIITNDYFMDPSNGHLESLESVLRRLQADKDRDVRMAADYPLN